MTQSLIDLTKIKDRDTTAAFDVAGTIMTNAGLTAAGLGIKGQILGAAAAAGVVGELFTVTCPTTSTTATVTITSANPGVVTWTTHGFSTVGPTPVVFTTSGALPTNITSGTVYYVVPSSVTTSTFQIATTIANALVPTPIDCTAGAQSGTQTGTAGCALATGVAINMTGLALTAGDWDVWAQISFTANAATVVTNLIGSISQTTATLYGYGKVVGGSQTAILETSQTATNGVPHLTIPMATVNVAATTNIFLVAQAAFATNILGAYGFLAARRRA